ncbi:tyrosine--tRNA ligase [Mesomycoplasma ovipneumoniae]|uniref:tyrosine--tRNA ligase n=1 Tax=Mesomycoplasma ovipneumoniae TaxID=29562 RepID=UPI0029653005|nr:tyrosine--tRNA ligase [Mesomycoplasma ovipneumoniae]MDW2891316.1 tyrosine--tRNA ligase [Mesomycoplasma ovipneumoniae]
MSDKNKIDFLDELKQRGILKDITNSDRFLNLSSENGIYIGFDPTAPSLHLGNYISINLLQRLQNFGIKVLAVVGGATGMIGDPSFKPNERKLLDFESVKNNTEKIKNQLKSFNLPVFDNFEIYKDMNILTFLRDIGKNINIAYLLAKDSVSSRIESGLSYTEFSYQLIQGWDFTFLAQNHNIIAQSGGSDQWGNMVTGLDFIKKSNLKNKDKTFVFTTNLLTDENNEKFGKSLGKPIWLDKNMYSPFNLYQFLLNQSDSQAEKIMLWLSFLDLDSIRQLISLHNQNKKDRILQKELAKEVVFNIHGQKGLEIAEKITQILFNKINYFEITFNDKLELKKILPYFSAKIFDQNSLIELGIFGSKRELNEFISHKALEINGIKIESSSEINTSLADDNNLFLIKKGKKQFFIFELI